MKIFKKTYWLIFPLLIVVFMLITEKVFDVENVFVSTAISFVLAYILSPRIKIVQKQTGAEEQIKWLFFKRTIIIN